MSLVKLSNNGVKNITSVGNVGTGELKFISKQTASSSASISFTSGIDSTYKEYVFYFVNIHPQTDDVRFEFNMSTDGGSNYNVTKTTTTFRAYHNESDSASALTYDTGRDQAQETGFQRIFLEQCGNDNDQNGGGYLHLFNPSSTTFVKHFICVTNHNQHNDYNNNGFLAGYGNTTNSIDAIKFQMSSGNIDSGDILLYGVN